MPTPASEKILDLFREAHTRGTLVKLTLGAYRGHEKSLENIFVRPVRLQDGDRLQFVYRYTTRDVTKNLTPKEALARLAEHLEKDFGSAHLFTTEFTGQWKRGSRRLITGRPRHDAPPALAHDRPKQRLIAADAGWLRALDAKPDKVRQIQKFVEILSHLIELPPPALRFVDMGCGKGYLTFALWHTLRVKVTGIEQRPELVAAANELVRQTGATGLEFVTGTISDVKLPAVDALIALHACNTATDDAIRQGVTGGVKLIVVAPCCHQEVRPQLGQPAPLGEVLRHGLMAERMAEWATDGLRVLVLEWAGYRTKVIEFVGSEHTPKNLMIVAIREREPFTSQATRERIAQFKTFFGITQHALDDLGRD